MDGDEWKGEQDDGLTMQPFGFVPMKPLTPEQREAYEKAKKAEEAKRQLRYDLLPPYRPLHRCVKCGSTEPARTRYDNGAYSFGEGRESLLRTCRNCRYVWHEQTMSEEES